MRRTKLTKPDMLYGWRFHVIVTGKPPRAGRARAHEGDGSRVQMDERIVIAVRIVRVTMHVGKLGGEYAWKARCER